MHASTDSKAQQAVAEFQGQCYSPTDLNGFFKKIRRVRQLDDGPRGGPEHGRLPRYRVDARHGVRGRRGTGRRPPCGSQAADFCQSIEDRLNQDFQKIGSRGISIIFSSGDSGSGFKGQKCNSNFPGESPWVTPVGATRFLQMAVGPEGAVQFFKSGGGFSWVWKTPDYQVADVKSYLNSAQHLPQSSQYNAAGRGTPDVAALGINFQVLYRGQWMGVGGTSASAPTFSGMITLLNDYLLTNGKQTMGFLNPWIYKHKDMFYDVTVGDNFIGGVGFKCQQGWDPVTGLGTLDFKKAKAVLDAEMGL
jgi:Subtilase family